MLYPGVVFMSVGKQNEVINTQIGIAKALLHENICFVVTKWELSKTAKLSVLKSDFVLIPNYGLESWVMNERMLSKVQMTFSNSLRRDTSRQSAQL